ncbi:protein Peter pan [Nilaparvata lugens]|uniref:protein Peter pan n=1 Tax=Nilaparvata lugens TaxID=108931 RepID=UPI00193CD852|nr:protein Peter pan [Nilaparvata lugens]
MGKNNTKKGRAVKKNKQTKLEEPDELTRAPHSFVIHKGEVGQYVQDLTKDFRKLMEPFTASSLKVRRKNVVKDFVSVAGLLHVSHMVMFTRTDSNVYMRIARLPRGPTLTFKVHSYALARDVLSLLRKQFVVTKHFKHSPLVILNSFSGEGAHIKLMASMFQNMFPAINLANINLDTVCRSVLFNYNQETKMIDLRHYAIRVVPVGLSKGIKKIVQSKVPNLSKFNDVSEYITKAELLSDSEAEDDPKSHVTLPQKLSSRGNMESSQSAIRLSELGPRMSLQLIKIESGLMEGDVMFHELVTKTEAEIKIINKRKEEKRKLKEQRKRVQEQNKQNKEAKKEELKNKSLEGMKKKQLIEENKKMLERVGVEDGDNDADWYRKEVGEEPDQGLFTQNNNSERGFKRRKSFTEMKELKKRKLNNGGEKKNNRDDFNRNKKSNRDDYNRNNRKTNSKFGNNANDKKFKHGEGRFNSNRKGTGRNRKPLGSKVTRGRRHV